MNEPGAIGPTNEALRRRYSLQGGAGPILTLATDAFPVIPVSDDQMDVAGGFPAGLYHMSASSGVVTPTAGELAAALIANPNNSGRLIMVDSFGASASAASDYELRMLGAAPASPVAVVAGVPRDSRKLGQSASAVVLAYSNPASVGTVVQRYRMESATKTDLVELPVVLRPNTCLMLISGTVTLSWVFGFNWRERTATTEELAAGS